MWKFSRFKEYLSPKANFLSFSDILMNDVQCLSESTTFSQVSTFPILEHALAAFLHTQKTNPRNAPNKDPRFVRQYHMTSHSLGRN